MSHPICTNRPHIILSSSLSFWWWTFCYNKPEQTFRPAASTYFETTIIFIMKTRTLLWLLFLGFVALMTRAQVTTGGDGDEDTTPATTAPPDDQKDDKVEKVKDYKCNICGCKDCKIADSLGVVWFTYDNKQEKRPCLQLQQEVENPNIYNTTYCKSTIWKNAFEPCLCYNVYTPEMILSDIPGAYNTNAWFSVCGMACTDSLTRTT